MKRILSHLFVLIGLSITTPQLYAQDLQSVEKGLLQEIKSSTKKYQAVTQSISSERRALLKRLASEEAKLASLEKKAAAAARNKDEQTLSLQKLEQRLEKWQQQQQYLAYLLADITPATALINLKDLQALIQKTSQGQQLSRQQISLENGNLIDGTMFSLGTQAWFLSDDRQTGGLITQTANQWQMAYLFSGAELTELQELFEHSEGKLALDPSNNRSLLLVQSEESITQHLDKGGIWIFPILFFALLSLVIASFKAFNLYRLPKLVTDPNAKRQSGIYQTRLETIAQTHKGITRDDLLFSELMLIKRKLEKGLTAIAVTASVAPLLGLLGTVSGMIQTFKLMTLFGSGDANAVSGGISESLVTTELGLMVAIPALIAHALLSRRSHHYLSELESYSVKLSQQESAAQ